MNQDSTFMAAYHGYLKNMLRWDDLAQLWEAVREDGRGPWYIYAVGEMPPSATSDAKTVEAFTRQMDELLHREHDEDYCGIVYVDNPVQPNFIKIYDPNNLGSVCGSGFGAPPLPGWILSVHTPVDLKVALPPPANRRRWWQRLITG